MSRRLDIEVSELAKAHIRAAEDWWRLNRPKAPNAIREELERASLLISVQPQIGARARNVSLSGVPHRNATFDEIHGKGAEVARASN